MAQYNHRWKETSDLASKEMTAKVWRNAIDGLSDAQIRNGYDQISAGKCHLDFPPTPAQFRILCQSKPDEGQLKTSNDLEAERDSRKKEKLDKLNRDRRWFSKLTDEGKMVVWDSATKAQYSFVEIFKNGKSSILDDNFENDPWFPVIIDAFKRYNRIA